MTSTPSKINDEHTQQHIGYRAYQATHMIEQHIEKQTH